MKVYLIGLLWLWPALLGLLSMLLWFFGVQVPIEWNMERGLFAGAWVALPILCSPGLRW